MTQIPKEQLQDVFDLLESVTHQVNRAFIGQKKVPQLMLTALLAQGHVLLEGVPGVAKTTLVKTFAQTLGCSFKRIQFTPDLLPSDITGTHILDMNTNRFVLRPGPIFANVVLADEINRAPAKTQSALLEAMQEAQVTVEGETQLLQKPFLVMATQNPIEHEGTYPLPEAQVDRFLLKIPIGHPAPEDEKKILITYNRQVPEADPVLDPQLILSLQQTADAVHVDEELMEYIIQLATFTRRHPRVYLGVSPRASLMLLRAAKARALVSCREYTLPDDVKSLAHSVLAHRILLAPEAELEGVQPEEIVAEALKKVQFISRR